MKKIFYLFAICAITSVASAQQDKHFSMFFANPVQINPAIAGHGLGTVQLFTNFRTQWFTLTSQPFRSISASMDAKLFDRGLSNGFIGAGINFLNDVSGDAKYSLNIISVPLNYSLELNDHSYLSLGLQPGVYAQRLTESTLYFENQWTGVGFDQGMTSGETLGDYNLSKFDLSAGLFYKNTVNENLDFQVGLSGFHLTGQQVGFTQLSEKLYRNFMVYSQVNIWTEGSNISFHPALFGLFQGPNYELTFGNNFEYEMKPASQHTGYFDGMSLSLGLYYRTNDALITNLIYKAGALAVGVSYDFNLSGLTVATNSVGAVEVFLKFNPYVKPKFGSPRIH
ncbi:MAG: PorP/SprF family type IX secretion system membrane protein [Crocinitomicaceae bacterium]